MLLSTELSQKSNRAASKAAYYAANKGKITAYQAVYRSSNKEKKAAYQVAYRAANKGKLAAYDASNKDKRAAYYAANKEKVAVYQAANRVEICATKNTKNRNKKLALIEHMGGKCKDCLGTFIPSVYEFHHVDPSIKDAKASKLFAKGLTAPVIEELKKCVMLCANCHRIRHATLEL